MAPAGGACPVAHGRGSAATDGAALRAELAALVASQDYPCVGAKSVFNRGTALVRGFDELGGQTATRELYAALARFSADNPPGAAGEDPELVSFVAVFRQPERLAEPDFEERLWRQLSMLHALDTFAWDPSVSSDPASPHFGFSVAGRAFFVIGMHPDASRAARRSPLPTMVFNVHSQFEQLRSTGRYDRIRDVVRKRDRRLQGDNNPMLADHGLASEARQYAGRAVPADWRPPYDFAPGRKGSD